MGRHKDPDSERSAKGKSDIKPVTYIGREPLDAPPAPDFLDDDLRESWEEFFTSDLALAVYRPTDYESFRRLWWLRQQVRSLGEVFDREPIVLGSRGQPVANPAGSLVATYNQQLRGLEDRFGMSPRARRNLGVDLGRRKLGVESLAVID